MVGTESSADTSPPTRAGWGPNSRAAFLADATSGARNAVVITEGLLLYLSGQQVGALADDPRRKEIGGWITDLIAPVIVRE